VALSMWGFLFTLLSFPRKRESNFEMRIFYCGLEQVESPQYYAGFYIYVGENEVCPVKRGGE
jgi:hypothetical protein